MPLMTEEQILAAYEEVSSKDGLLYHVAHARKANSDADYDGAKLREVSDQHVDEDIRRMLDASTLFRNPITSSGPA